MTIFKGLMTTETTLGIADLPVTNGNVETGGGFCVFSTTFAIPESVIQGVIQKLKSQDFPGLSGGPQFRSLFHWEQHDPDPQLGIITIVENNVTIEAVNFAGVGLPNFSLNAQGTVKAASRQIALVVF